MKHLTIIFILSFFVFSCTSNTIFKKPDNLIPKDSMIDLLVEIQIATAAKSAKNLEGNFGINYMPFIYEKHKIDSARFSESSFYYTTDIDHYTKILKAVKARIDQLHIENETLLEIKDSIKKAGRPALEDSVAKDSIIK